MKTITFARRPARFPLAIGLLAANALAACERSPSEPTYTGPPFDSLVVTLSSTLAVGHVVRPTLAVERRLLRTIYVSSPEIDAATHLTTSNPDILSVTDGAIRANAVGRAIITGRLANRQTSIVVDAVPGYPVSYLEGSDGLTVAGVNDGGDVIGTRATGGNVLIHQGVFTDLQGCQPHAINNAGQIACVVFLACPAPCYRITPGLYAAGTLTTPFDTAYGLGTGISESGVLFGWVRAADGHHSLFLWSSAGWVYPNKHFEPWFGSTFTINSALNGIVVDETTLYPHSFILRSSSYSGLGSAGGRWSWAVDINDADDAVGTSERMQLSSEGDVGGAATIWRASTAWKPENPSYRADVAAAISETGYVVGSGKDGAYVWRDGRYTILTDALADAGWTLISAPAISRNGKVAAIGQHTSGKKGVVLIDLGIAP